MIIEKIVSKLLKSNMYLISENNRYILIDPCVAERDICNVDYILLTHEHYDHISGVNYWKEKTGAIVVASERCAENCCDSRKNLSRYFKAFCELQTWIPDYDVVENCEYICQVDDTYNRSKMIYWQGHTIELYICPGHSEGGAIIAIDGKHIFSGDSILQGTEIECGLPGGDIIAWENEGKVIVDRISRGSIIHPGHFDDFIL